MSYPVQSPHNPQKGLQRGWFSRLIFDPRRNVFLSAVRCLRYLRFPSNLSSFQSKLELPPILHYCFCAISDLFRLLVRTIKIIVMLKAWGLGRGRGVAANQGLPHCEVSFKKINLRQDLIVFDRLFDIWMHLTLSKIHGVMSRPATQLWSGLYSALTQVWPRIDPALVQTHTKRNLVLKNKAS